MGVVKCIVYIAVSGCVAFVLGRIAPKSWFHADRFPFRTYEWESKVWKAIRIKQWQAKLPDMSRILDFFLPDNEILPLKKITESSLKNLPLMIQETCVSELTHAFLCFSGLAMLWIYPGWGGVLITFLYVFLGNLPFVWIQRFNRPRLERALAQQDARRARQARQMGFPRSVASIGSSDSSRLPVAVAASSVALPSVVSSVGPSAVSSVASVALVPDVLVPDVFRSNMLLDGVEAVKLGV